MCKRKTGMVCKESVVWRRSWLSASRTVVRRSLLFWAPSRWIVGSRRFQTTWWLEMENRRIGVIPENNEETQPRRREKLKIRSGFHTCCNVSFSRRGCLPPRDFTKCLESFKYYRISLQSSKNRTNTKGQGNHVHRRNIRIDSFYYNLQKKSFP